MDDNYYAPKVRESIEGFHQKKEMSAAEALAWARIAAGYQDNYQDALDLGYSRELARRYAFYKEVVNWVGSLLLLVVGLFALAVLAFLFGIGAP